MGRINGRVDNKTGGFIFDLVPAPEACNSMEFAIYGSFKEYRDSSSYNAFYAYCVKGKDAILTEPTDWLENFVCDVEFKCPDSCTCYSQPYNATFHVLCAGVGLTELPLDLPFPNMPFIAFLRTEVLWGVDPITKYKLDVSGNDLQILEARPYFDNTVVLDASHSQIENITDEALEALKNVDRIYLHKNLLTTLPRLVEAINFSFTSLSLCNNSFDCSCDQAWLKEWLNNIDDRIDNSDGIICTTPPRLHGKTIWSVNESDFCYVLPPDAEFIASAIVAPLVCIAAAISCPAQFRVESYKRFRFHPFDRDECAGEEMTYDVFISYAHEDKELLPFAKDYAFFISVIDAEAPFAWPTSLELGPFVLSARLLGPGYRALFAAQTDLVDVFRRNGEAQLAADLVASGRGLLVAGSGSKDRRLHDYLSAGAHVFERRRGVSPPTTCIHCSQPTAVAVPEQIGWAFCERCEKWSPAPPVSLDFRKDNGPRANCPEPVPDVDSRSAAPNAARSVMNIAHILSNVTPDSHKSGPASQVSGAAVAANDASNVMLGWARHYEAKSWPVFPLHTPVLGRCSCGNPTCKPVGKHPRTPDGLKAATTDLATLRGWWGQWPEANIGLATGGAARLVVLDVDGPEGEASLEAKEAEIGGLPDTREVRTGREGGRHLYFRLPQSVDLANIKNSAHKIGDKLDVRASGGYVVVPPSLHVSGKRYEWVDGNAPVAELPLAWCEALAKRGATTKTKHGGEAPPRAAGERWGEGERNQRLCSYAGSLRARGYDQEAIVEALRKVNAERCDPPLDEAEVDTIAASVAGYPKGYAFSDSGNAERLVERHGDRIHYVPKWKKWISWEENRWTEEGGDLMVANLAKETARALAQEALKDTDDDRRKRTCAWALQSESAARARPWCGSRQPNGQHGWIMRRSTPNHYF